MANAIPIPIELCAEDRARADRLIELLGHLADARCSECAALVHRAAEAAVCTAAQPTPEPPKATEPEHPADADLPWPTDKPVQPSVAPEAVETMRSQLQSKMVCLVAAGGDAKKQAVAIVKEYADKVSAVPADQLAEVLARLEAIA